MKIQIGIEKDLQENYKVSLKCLEDLTLTLRYYIWLEPKHALILAQRIQDAAEDAASLQEMHGEKS